MRARRLSVLKSWLDTISGLILAGAAVAGAVMTVRARLAKSAAPRRTLLLAIALLASGIAGTYVVVRLVYAPTAQTPAARSALLALIDAGLRAQCTNADFDATRIIARVTCDDRRDNVEVTFSLYADPRSMEAVIARRGAELGAPAGDCKREEFAMGRYSDSDRPDAGWLLCYGDEDVPTLEWTNTQLSVYGMASQTGRARRTLMQWWQDAGGISRRNARRAFPDEYERRLRGYVPAEFRDRCGRSTWTPSTATNAVLRCDVRAGATTAWYLLFPSLTSLERYYESSTSSVRGAKGSCSKDGDEPAETAYRDGRRACYTDSDDDSWIEWTDEPLLVYAYGFRRGDRLHRLFEWWENAGPADG